MVPDWSIVESSINKHYLSVLAVTRLFLFLSSISLVDPALCGMRILPSLEIEITYPISHKIFSSENTHLNRRFEITHIF